MLLKPQLHQSTSAPGSEGLLLGANDCEQDIIEAAVLSHLSVGANTVLFRHRYSGSFGITRLPEKPTACGQQRVKVAA